MEIKMDINDNIASFPDGGELELLEVYGNELDMVNGARISFGKQKKVFDWKDRKLLKYLVKNRHTSPIELVAVKLKIKCPIFIARQWHRHRTWSYNEISRRYTSEDISFWVPEEVRIQAKVNKQCSESGMEKDEQAYAIELIEEANAKCNKIYEDLIAAGVCREQARAILPQSAMTEFVAMVDLHNLCHFLNLRDHDHAQLEIRQYARAIKELLWQIMPDFMEILDEVEDERQLDRDIFDQQKRFMYACGQKVAPYYDPCQLFNPLREQERTDEVWLWCKLIDEEYDELWEALDDLQDCYDKQTSSVPIIEKMVASVVSESIDLVYVTAGLLNRMGVPAREIWDAIHKANMNKVDPKTGKVTKREDGKILKPEGWKPADVVEILRKHTNDSKSSS